MISIVQQVTEFMKLALVKFKDVEFDELWPYSKPTLCQALGRFLSNVARARICHLRVCAGVRVVTLRKCVIGFAARNVGYGR